MAEYDLLVTGGIVIDPSDKTEKRMNLAVKDGVIIWIGEGIPGEAERVLDVDGCMICPGFIDTHMHDEEIDDPDTTQMALLRQGVTTCIAGNCGAGPLQEKIRPSRAKPWLNIGYMTGHTALREEVGIAEKDRYRPATVKEIARMKDLLVSELKKGSFGLSLGLEYNPETSWDEIVELARVVPGFGKRWISSHIRYDGPRCLEAVEEMIKLASTVNGRVQISHLGSMTSFGFAADALKLLNDARAQGLDLTWDSYPYAAFSTYLGSAVFDPGFEKRFNKPISALEVGSGLYAGKRLDRELFEQLRKEHPRTIIVAHVMNEEEMKLILRDPLCAIASDAVLFEGRGHPRVAGAFPRGINWLREEGLTWSEAIDHATAIPAEMCWLNRGQIKTDSTADLVIFDPQTFADRATFEEPLLPPEGIRYVILNGKVAVDDGDLNADPCGTFLTRR